MPCLIAVLRLLLDYLVPLTFHFYTISTIPSYFYYYIIVILALQHLPFIGVNPKVYNPFPLTSTYHHKIYLLHSLVFSKKLLRHPRDICFMLTGEFFFFNLRRGSDNVHSAL